MKKPIRKSGILAHPTSFPSEYGIGDLGQGAYDFVDFLRKSNQSYWQVLPLGPTSFGDSPYQSFSTFAGNPMLISPDILVKDGFLLKEDLINIPAFDPLKVDYGKVIKYKNTLFKLAYDNFKEPKSAKIKKTFKEFCEKNEFWLDDYTLFIALKGHFIEHRRLLFEPDDYKKYRANNKDKMTEDAIKDYYYGAVWNSWPQELETRENEALVSWREKLKNEIDLLKFLQFIFFKQWEDIKKYANKYGIEIIGDIPIFVAMDSSDVWANPHLFQMDKTGRRPASIAGVPPDYFSEDGQLWGNPLYDWKAHKKEKYSWWISRIKSCLNLYDHLRIDHFRGFESYWEIPYGNKTAVKGKWQKGPGSVLFDEIKKALGDLPIIAEDLGIITQEVNELRDLLGFPGMKVLQFAFGDPGNRNLFLPHNFFNTHTVLYTGTHDNDTTLGWYKNGTEIEKDHLRRYMNISGEDVSWDLIRLAYSTSAEMVIVPVQDIMSLDSKHRMNSPGIAKGNWQFRYKKSMLCNEYAEKLVYLSDLYERNQHEKIELPTNTDKELELIGKEKKEDK